MLLADPTKRHNASLVAKKLQELTQRAREASKTYPASFYEMTELDEFSMPTKIKDVNTESVGEMELELQTLELSRDEVMSSKSPDARPKGPKRLQPQSDGIIDVITVDEWIQETVDDPKRYTRVTVRRTQRSPVPVANLVKQLVGSEQPQHKDDLSAMSTQELADTQAKLLAQLEALHEVQRVQAEKQSLEG